MAAERGAARGAAGVDLLVVRGADAFDAQLRTGAERARRRLLRGAFAAVRFVAVVGAVVETVADQRLVDAVAAGAAAELSGGAGATRRLAHQRVLVRSVVAVVVAVADLRLRDAQEVVAAELARRAAQVGAHGLDLVRTVGTVAVAVAAPQERRAFAVGAGELVRRARRVAVDLIRTVGAIDVTCRKPLVIIVCNMLKLFKLFRMDNRFGNGFNNEFDPKRGSEHF